MSEFQKMLLVICFLVSLLTVMILYTFQKEGYPFELCRDNECKIYKVKIVELENEKKH